MPHFCPFCSVLPHFCHRECENFSICSLQIAPMSSFQENLFRLEIIQYSRCRKLSSLLWNVLACDVSRVSLRFLSVLVNYKQSESMHDVWCLFCFFSIYFCWVEAHICESGDTPPPDSPPPFHRYMSGHNQKKLNKSTVAIPTTMIFLLICV